MRPRTGSRGLDNSRDRRLAVERSAANFPKLPHLKRTARAKGLSERAVILRHAFINSLIPLISLIGLTFPFVLSGSVILEYMFNWPGLGRLYFESVLGRDYPTIMALNFITAVLVLVTTFLADLAYGLVDPRVSYDR